MIVKLAWHFLKANGGQKIWHQSQTVMKWI